MASAKSRLRQPLEGGSAGRSAAADAYGIWTVVPSPLVVMLNVPAGAFGV